MAPYLSWRSSSPWSDLEECWVEGAGLGGGPSETQRIVPYPPLFTELTGGFDAITCKVIIKILQEALRKTLRIDITEANFTSEAVAPASLPLSCLLWNFTASHTFVQYALTLCFTIVICHPFLFEA